MKHKRAIPVQSKANHTPQNVRKSENGNAHKIAKDKLPRLVEGNSLMNSQEKEILVILVFKEQDIGSNFGQITDEKIGRFVGEYSK